MTISVTAFDRFDESKNPNTINSSWNNNGSILISAFNGDGTETLAFGGASMNLTAKFLRSILESDKSGTIFDDNLLTPGLFGAESSHVIVTTNGDNIEIKTIRPDLPKKGDERVDEITLPKSEWIDILSGSAEARTKYMKECGIRPLMGAIDPDVSTDAEGLEI